ncbi:MAG: adenosine kinase [Candidatus Aenigmarchaeota archaeon]|nr:adenosine kinase [Candidatus Aenigmarchaeota archaeon]
MTYDIFGFGNTLVDILIKVDESHIAELDLRKGTFHLVEEAKMADVLRRFDSSEKKVIPAGSAANTVFAAASLGASTVLCGKLGNDRYGSLYEEIIIEDNVKSALKRTSGSKTGTVINLVTSDGERTFVVNLGAAVTITKEELGDVEDDLKSSRIFHTEGYVIAHDALTEPTLHLLRTAKRNGVMVSIDLSDSVLVENNLDLFRHVIEKYADIAFFNEDEAMAFTCLGPEEAVERISELCGIAVVKTGSKGSLVKKRGKDTIRIKPVKAKVVDTTGAGDFYAAGFLYGLIRKKDITTCGNIGSAVAARVVEQMGARPPAGLRDMPGIKKFL